MFLGIDKEKINLIPKKKRMDRIFDTLKKEKIKPEYLQLIEQVSIDLQNQYEFIRIENNKFVPLYVNVLCLEDNLDYTMKIIPYLCAEENDEKEIHDIAASLEITLPFRDYRKTDLYEIFVYDRCEKLSDLKQFSFEILMKIIRKIQLLNAQNICHHALSLSNIGYITQIGGEIDICLLNFSYSCHDHNAENHEYLGELVDDLCQNYQIQYEEIRRNLPHYYIEGIEE